MAVPLPDSAQHSWRTDKTRVQIIGDDPDTIDRLSVGLRFLWQDVELIATCNGEEAMRVFLDGPPDLVILDLGLSDGGGFQLLEGIRQLSSVPLMLLSAPDSHEDEVRGLDMGADDYVVKPFSHMALLARIKALLRRARKPPLRRASGGMWRDRTAYPRSGG